MARRSIAISPETAMLKCEYSPLSGCGGRIGIYADRDGRTRRSQIIDATPQI